MFIPSSVLISGTLFSLLIITFVILLLIIFNNTLGLTSAAGIQSSILAILTISCLGFLFAQSQIFVYLLPPLVLLLLIHAKSKYHAIKEIIYQNLGVFSVLFFFAMPMYFLSALTQLKPLHQDGVNIFLFAKQLQIDGFTGYPIGLPSMQNFFFAFFDSPLYINFYGSLIGFLSLLFCTFILLHYLGSKSIIFFVLINSIFFLGPISIFRINNTTISLSLTLFLCILIILYERIIKNQKKFFFINLLLISITFSLLAPHVLISLLPFILVVNFVYFHELRKLIILLSPFFVLIVSVVTLIITSNFYGSSLESITNSSFVLPKSGVSQESGVSLYGAFNQYTLLSKTLLLDYFQQKPSIRLITESFFILSLYAIALISFYLLISSRIKKLEFLFYFSLYAVLLTSTFLLSVMEFTSLKGRIIFFIFVIFSIILSYYFNFLAYQKVILSIMFFSILFMNIFSFTQNSSTKSDLPYRYGFEFLIKKASNFNVLTQFDYFPLLFEDHSFQRDVRLADAKSFDLIFLDLNHSNENIQYSGLVEIGEDVDELKRIYDSESRSSRDQTIVFLEESRSTHEVFYYEEGKLVILQKIS